MHGTNDDEKIGRESTLSSFKVISFIATRLLYLYESFSNQPSETSKGAAYNSALVTIYLIFRRTEMYFFFRGVI
jgi:hypothetical protein